MTVKMIVYKVAIAMRHGAGLALSPGPAQLYVACCDFALEALMKSEESTQGVKCIASSPNFLHKLFIMGMLACRS